MTKKLNEISGKTALVTGGAGFIGSNLVKKLLENGAEKIIVIDNLSSGHKWLLPEDERIIFYKGDILNDEILKRSFSLRPKIVYHLAAHFANQNSVDHPETDLLVNGLGTLKVLQYSYISRVDRVVVAGSGCAVYGHDAPLPYTEDMPPALRYTTPYQIHKLLTELYGYWFHEYYKMPVSVVRYFNVYGPGEVPGKYRNVIPNFIYWAMNKQPLPITGTGEETRDFTYVEDAVEATILVSLSEEALGEPFNIAGGREIKIKYLADLVNKLTNNNAGIVFKQRRDWDKHTRRLASIEKAKKLLNWKPRTPFEEGLEKTVNWFYKNFDKILKSVKW